MVAAPESLSTEVVVVGGGIVGASAAYRLVRTGADVTIVDRADQGYATAAGAGIVPCSVADSAPINVRALFQRACAYYQELIPQLAEDGESDTGFDTVGALVLATDDDERARLAETLGDVILAGGATLIDPADAQRLFPPLRDDVTAFHLPEHARVDGRLLRDALLRAFERRGGRVVRGDARFVRAAGRVTAVDVAGQRIHAESFVAAVGAWGDVLGSGPGISPQRGQIVHLEVPGEDTSRWPILMDHVRRQYTVTFPANRVVAGSTFEDGSGYDYRVTAAGQAKLLADILHVAPGLTAATVVETRVGFRPKSRDGLPILGAAPEVDGLYLANGLGEIGLTMGPYAGVLVADLAIGRSPALDLAPYSPSRDALA